MVQTLENAGIALDSLAASVKGGHGDLGFMDAPSYERFATLSDETFEELSRRTGLPLNLLMLIREATGGATPGPNDRVRETSWRSSRSSRSSLRWAFGPFR
jgi:adenylate cyclase